MKIRNRFTLLGSLAALSTAPMAAADEVAVEPEIAVCWEGSTDFAEEPIIVVCPSFEGDDSVSIDPVIIDEDGEGTFLEKEIFNEEQTFEVEETYADGETYTDEESYNEEEVADGEVVEVTDGEVLEVTDAGEEVVPEVVYDGEGFEVPLDWIKRGAGDNPEIFYSLSNIGGPLLTPTRVQTTSETPIIARQIGPDSKATAIEGREASGVFQANRDKKGPVALVKEGRVFLR